jgi:pimeloyl-ACP methyl ester carboxylesterase
VNNVLTFLRKRNHYLPIFVLAIGAPLSAYSFAQSPSLGFLISVVTAYGFYMELMTQWSFRAPTRRKPSIEDGSWNPIEFNLGGHTVKLYHKVTSPGGPTALLIHGWTSGSIRMIQRSQPFLDRGWNVVLVDLPSHGGSSRLAKWSAEQSCTLLLGALNALDEQQQNLFSGPVVAYGHSMGCFIGLRISKRRSELTFGDQINGWVFESPMTGYTEIFDETCNLLHVPRVLRRALLRNTIRHFNAINQSTTTLTSLHEADMPLWGMPSEPLLLVQATPDERLGEHHHLRLTSVMEQQDLLDLLTAHYLSNLRHSGSHDHKERENVVGAWLDTHSSSF